MTFQDYQVLQRGADDTAHGLKVGGPYEIEGAKDVYVGDLWVLAGQSNMEGVGDLIDVETPHPLVRSFQSVERWAVAEEPLHWLGESPRFIHHKLWGREALPEQPDPRDPNRTKGSGCGLSFAKAYHAATGVPVGLIPSAHGGTSMDQWDPALKGEGGGSLYGATLERVKANGGRVKGILWYQGESDASPEGAGVYYGKMERLIAAFREDFGDPDLPFYLVQLGCFAAWYGPESVQGWNSARESQRRLASSIPNVKMVSAIDLELDDLIHIGVQGLKRLGKRLAAVSQGAPTLDLASVTWDTHERLRVQYSGVRGGLTAPGRPTGFTLRTAEDGPADLIYKVTLDGDTAVLHLNNNEDTLPGGLVLHYGYGLNPYCNITDSDDMAVPAFGPLPLPARTQ